LNVGEQQQKKGNRVRRSITKHLKYCATDLVLLDGQDRCC